MPVVQIVGGGIAGLVASIGFARQGWAVKLHERSDQLRANGNGFPIFENGLRVIEALGLGGEIETKGHRLNRWVIRRSTGEKAVEYEPYTATGGRIVMFHRQAIIDVLARAAADAGVEIIVGSKVVGADREGAITLGNGDRASGDLVIGADGIHSAVRRSVAGDLPLGEHRKGAIRLLIPIEEGDFPDGDDRVATEYNDTSGRRIGLLPCSSSLMYMILVALLTDKPANAMPIDVDLWSKTFPTLRRYIERVGDKGHYDVYHSVYPPSWHYGKCVLIGDAAHGMTPALGQGANTAMMTAYALAAAIGREVPQEGVLDEWEASMRPLVNSTQRYAEGITAGKLDPNNEIFFSDPALRSLLGVDIPRIYKEASIGSRSVVAPAAIHAE